MPRSDRWRQGAALAGAVAALVGIEDLAMGARPTPGALTADRLKLPSGPSSVRGLADEPMVNAFSAQVTYDVPLELPAGFGQLAPALGFSYSGSLGNGPLGIGWAMPGIRIERSTRLGVPRFDASDELEISGVGAGRLVPIDASGTEFRVEGMGQTVRVKRSADGAGFEVDDGSGTHYRLGVSAGSRQGGPRGTLVWLVEEATNQAGERVQYEYETDEGQVYPSRIVWGPGGAFEVALEYEQRPDLVTSYREGFRVVTARRLKAVRVNAFGGERRAYQLRYDNTFSVSRLKSVGSTGLAGSGEWPSLTFGYSNPGAPAVEAVAGAGNWRLNANGVTLVDLDGDGASDLLQAADNNHSYRLNQQGVYGNAQALTGVSDSLSTLQLMDVDGDARAELVKSTGAEWMVYRFKKTKWELVSSAWPGTAHLALKNPTQARYADLNGDGLVDGVRWDNDNVKVHWATTTGFGDERLVGRIGGAVVPGDRGRFQDLNGDGLDDYIELQPTQMDVYLGHGDGTFEPKTVVAYPFTGDVSVLDDVQLADLDRDGLLDLVRVELGNVKWYRGKANGTFATTAVSLANPEQLNAETVVTLQDQNGNGSADVVWSSVSGMWRMDLAGPTTAGMLTRVQNGLGMDVTFVYRSSHSLSAEARGNNDPWLYEVPMSIPVPIRKITVLGPGETTRKIDYAVRDGFWDASERRFGGFLGTIVTTWGATPAETSSVQTRYLPGLGASRLLRGKPLVEQVRDGTGRRLSMTTNSWETQTVTGLPDAPLLQRAILRESKTRYEDTSPAREARTTYEYDGLGRARRTTNWGRLDLDFDQTVEEKTYADDATTWVRDRVCEDKVLGSDGQLVSDTQFLFGDESTTLPLCSVGKGWPRETRAWLASESRFVTQESTSYDAHANPVELTRNGVTREIVYDADGLFPVEERAQVSDDRELVWRMTWDKVLGAAVDLEDPNGHHNHVRYDGLGRTVGMSFDGRPEHVLFEYDWSGTFPKTTTWQFDGKLDDVGALPGAWADANHWRQSVQVSNGRGEPRYRAERLGLTSWIISDYRERDPASRVTFQGRPIRTDRLELTARPAGMVGESLVYDPLGRLLEQRLPNGGKRVYTYTEFERTVKLDDLATTHMVTDGQGRVIQTDRTLADGSQQRIDARYDAASRLVSMVLGANQVTRTFEYDTLGRMTRSNDPDLGARELFYDDDNRLTDETNALGETTHYAYDRAGRLVERRIGSGTPYRYYYDAPRAGTTAVGTVGRLAWVEEPNGRVEMGYDTLGRMDWVRRQVDDRVAEERTTYATSGLVLEQAYDDGLVLGYRYDPLGRLVGINDLWTLLDQDAAGNVLSERFQNGVVSTYQRDPMGLVSKVTVKDASGAPIYDVGLTRRTWGAIDTVTDVDHVGLDHSEKFDYDTFGRLVGATVGSPIAPGNGVQPYTFGYSYDGLQNMVQRSASGPRSLDLLAGSYRYGEQGKGPRQLTSVVAANGARRTFDYDAAGRQISKDGMSMQYDALDQLLRVDGLPGGGSVRHEYGYDGLRTKTVTPDGDASYWFNETIAERHGVREHDVHVGDRVVARVSLARAPAAAAASSSPSVGVVGIVLHVLPWGVGLLLVGFTLTSAGAMRRKRPLRLTAAGLVTTVLFAACGGGDPDEALVERTQSVSWTRRDDVFMHVGVGAGPSVFTDAAGRLLEERRYEPFGEEIDARLRSGNDYVVGAPDLAARDLNGLNKRTESTTGWSYHGARWLAPETGRWLTPDPPTKAPDADTMLAPWDLHPYQYVGQNPVIYWDPDGNNKVLDWALRQAEAKLKSSAAKIMRGGQWDDYIKAEVILLHKISGQVNKGMALRARMEKLEKAVDLYEKAVANVKDANSDIPDDPLAVSRDNAEDPNGPLSKQEKTYVKNHYKASVDVRKQARSLVERGKALQAEYVAIQKDVAKLGTDEADTHSGRIVGMQAEQDLADFEMRTDGQIGNRISAAQEQAGYVAEDADEKASASGRVIYQEGIK